MAARHPLRIEDLLSPVSTADFLRDYYGRSILHLEGEGDRWESVFSWPDLNAILSSHRLSAPQLRLVRAGAAIDEASYTEAFGSRQGGTLRRLDAGRVSAALRSGATLVLHAVDDLAPSLSGIAYQVEHLIRAPVTVNLYATWGGAEGFNVHWDDHDVFVLQVAGTKRWQVYAPTQAWPSERAASRPPSPQSSPVAEVLLDAGHLLYIPHGWWHVANAEESPSLHLTVGVRAPSGIDLLDYVFGLLTKHEPVRRRIPRFETDGSAEEYVTTVAALVEKALNVETLQDCLRNLDGQQYRRLAVSLPYAVEERPAHSLPDDALLSFLAPTAIIEELPGRVVLQAGNNRLTFRPPDVAPLLRYLSDTSGFTMAGLLAMPEMALSETQVRAVVGELMKAGLIGVF
jgi:hypothetical protein